MARVSKVVKISAQELDRVKQNRNGVIGIPRKHMEEKAEALASQEEWASFIDILALLVFGTVLFPNMDGLVDLVAIDAFLAYHHNKESPIIAMLVDTYDTLDLRCEKSSAKIIYCTPALYMWLVSHIFHHEGGPICPVQGHRMCAEKGKANWEELLAGYPMRGEPSEKSIAPFITRGSSDPNAKMLQRVRKAWKAVQRKDKELRGSSSGVIGGYHKWLKARTQGIT
ncbi:uncharacterized protein LOC114389869 [Glycine soja]|uniref:uncharacterized protein LOC114389869 n=1 Tax=Glycine soja TaxID=3848 RepID=UPI00103EAEA8|nr:uncharacterized protein LOC114389869 [Glycine soja]